MLQAVWFEVLCGSLLLLVVAARSFQSSSSARKGAPDPKKRSVRSSTAAVQGVPSAEAVEARTEVQKEIRSLFLKANAAHAQTFELYHNLVRERKINLREEIRDPNTQQALFVSLMSACASLPKASTKETTIFSLVQDMRSMEVPRSVVFYANLMKTLANRGLQRENIRSCYAWMVEDKIEPDATMCICLMNDALSCDEPQKATFFFRELQKLQTPSMRTYMTMIRILGRQRDWRGAETLLSEMQKSNVSPDNLVFNNVLGVCVNAGQPDAARRLVRNWRDAENVVDVISYNTVLKGYAQNSDLAKADALLGEMLEQHSTSNGVAPNLISFNTLMDCAVRSLGREGRAHQQAGRSHNHHPRAGDPPGENARRKIWKVLDMIESRGLVPDIYTASTLIKGMHIAGGDCTAQQLERAVNILRKVSMTEPGSAEIRGEAGGVPDKNERLHEVLFNSMLDACVNFGDLSRMAEVFTLMRERSVPVSAVTFGTLVKAFGQAGRPDRCSEVWEEMRRAAVSPSVVTYGCYIDALTKNGQMERALDILEEMRKKDGVEPNTVVYTTLLKGFSRAREPQKALQVYQDMRARGVHCSQLTFNSMLDVLVRNPQPENSRALDQVLEDMKAAGCKADVVTYSIMVKSACASGSLDQAMTLFERATGDGLVLDEVSFNSMLHGFCKDGKLEFVERVFAEMQRAKVRPTNVTASILCKSYGRAKKLDKAFEVLELMESEYGEKPNCVVYTCLIQACVRNGQVKRGWDLFHTMIQNGLQPDAVTFGALIHGCIYNNKFDMAMQLVRKAYCINEDGAPFGEKGGTVVNLQPEVMKVLSTALARKKETKLSEQLNAVLARNQVAEAGGGRSRRGA